MEEEKKWEYGETAIWDILPHCCLKRCSLDTSLYVFGVNQDKLDDFSFVDETYLVREIPKDISIDHAIECVGGDGSQKAIQQIIDLINPEGTISILGVSEYPIPIETRMILEKGLRLFGSSRSGRKDFVKTVELFKKNPEIVDYLSNIVGAVVEVNTIKDMTKAFELDIQKAFGKTIMVWKNNSKQGEKKLKTYIENFKKYRFLLVELVKKGIKLKYRRSYLGILWTLLEPLLTMIVLTIVFGSMFGNPDPTFPVYILTGRLLVQLFFFSNQVGQ